MKVLYYWTGINSSQALITFVMLSIMIETHMRDSFSEAHYLCLAKDSSKILQIRCQAADKFLQKTPSQPSTVQQNFLEEKNTAEEGGECFYNFLYCTKF